MLHLPVEAQAVSAQLVVQQRFPAHKAPEHQSLDEHDAPADRLFLAKHLNSLLRKWVVSQVPHLPVEAQAVSAQLVVQQWSPAHDAPEHHSLDEQDAPADRLFLGKHLNSSLRKYEASQMLHLPVKAHFEHPEA